MGGQLLYRHASVRSDKPPASVPAGASASASTGRVGFRHELWIGFPEPLAGIGDVAFDRLAADSELVGDPLWRASGEDRQPLAIFLRL
jgi:hypothetical protein